MRTQHPKLNVVHMTADAFVSCFVQAIRQDSGTAFSAFMASADALVLDDVELIGGRERTHEELFLRLSDLLLRDVQIVLTSDRPSAQIPALAARARARLEGGLVLEVGYPDKPALVQIARRAALEAGVILPEDALNLIAECCSGGVREIQSAIARITAERAVAGQRGSR
jgi:chromosomal replication initiator protein